LASNLELVQKLEELEKLVPERFEEIKKRPEWNIYLQVKDKIKLVALARQDSPDGFFAYYEGKYGFQPPYQVKKWIRRIYEGHGKGLGFTLNGYRGSWKTISVSITFLEFRIGHEPWKTNLVIRASDITAQEITDKITDTIAFLPWWKDVFPNVVPDEQGRWSTNGYSVIDKSVDKGEWTKLVANTADPTLVGGGYTSQKINGKHPTGVCLTDDLHGMNNSSSDTERKAVVDFYTTELSKTFVYKDKQLETWPINIGVPWGKGGKDDVHQALSKSGAFVVENYPVMTKVAKDTENAVYIDGLNEETGVIMEDIQGYWVLSNPEEFDVIRIKRSRGVGKFDFWQMMMMDLKSALDGGLQYFTFKVDENNKIDTNWPAVAGCDPSFTFKERAEYEVKSSSFALGVGLKRPMGGAVLADGVLEQCSTNKAAGHIAAMQSRFKNFLYTAVENVGIGALFLETMRKINPSLILVGSDLGGIRPKGEKAGKAKDKATRFRTEAAPWLEKGTFLISTEKSDYLDAIRDGLENFSELDPHKPDKRWDALDSFYHIIKAMPDVTQQKSVGQEITPIHRQPMQHPLAGRKLYGR
jgi:hypothetical protein